MLSDAGITAVIGVLLVLLDALIDVRRGSPSTFERPSPFHVLAERLR